MGLLGVRAMAIAALFAEYRERPRIHVCPVRVSRRSILSHNHPSAFFHGPSIYIYIFLSARSLEFGNCQERERARAHAYFFVFMYNFFFVLNWKTISFELVALYWPVRPDIHKHGRHKGYDYDKYVYSLRLIFSKSHCCCCCCCWRDCSRWGKNWCV